jgi:endoglucanase
MAVLESILGAPTAPFHEEAVIAQVRLWAEGHKVAFAFDACGNVLLRYRRGRAQAKWVFEAHMDHPGFVVRKAARRAVLAEFIGGVRREFFPNARVRFFTGDNSVAARVVSVRQTKKSPFLQCRLELAREVDLREGDIGMWDFPPMRITGRRLSGRACDDVVGSAAVLCAMGEIVAGDAPCDVTALLTRAEEAGFIGTLGACEKATLPKDAFVVAIETSKAQAAASLGAGVVVRVGDIIRTFDPSLTAHVSAVAAALAKRDRQFKYTRQLMPGGATEASAYMMYGYTATGLCLPLGNYHNMGPRGRIAPEQIDLDDFESLVKLLVALSADKGSPAETDDRLRRRFKDLLKSRGGFLSVI